MRWISIEKNRDIKIDNEINYFLNPDYIYVPGEDIEVVQNETVYRGMNVCKGHISSVSGIAFGMKKCSFENKWHNSLVIKNNFREVQKKRSKVRKLTIDNILTIIENNKDFELLEKFKSQLKFDNIVISTINDEPYVVNNIYILKENIDSLLELLDNLSLLYKCDNSYLVVKNVDTALITECLNVIGTYPNIALTLVSDEYLLESWEFLKEKIEIKGNTLYLTSKELLMLNNYIKGKDNDTVLITISGDGIDMGKIIRVKKYTLLKDILNKYIKIIVDKYEIIANGLMCGYKISNVDSFVIDGNVSSIHIMKKPKKVNPECINCGKCIEVCPLGVSPLTGKNKDKCIACNLCSYMCPGFVNLKDKLRG